LIVALRALRRLARGLLHTLRGLLICAFVFPRLDGAARMRQVGAWSARLLALLDIECVVEGAVAEGPVMVVANHVSWLDILALNAVRPARFVAKADMRHWPLLGWLIACGGTLFIEREKKRDALRVVHQVAEALRRGERIAVFPEGTIGAGGSLLPFHANLLQAAISAGAPIQPVALRYGDAHARFSAAVDYVGDTTLLQSIARVLAAERLCVHVTQLGVEPPTLGRRALAARLHARIGAALADQPLP
jgi:1-acyl-sn-glycerol-3-phosphate acyltransferase